MSESIQGATTSPDAASWRTGYHSGFRRGCRAVAESVNAVLDGYDFAGNALAKAIGDEYREMIRSRLKAALAWEASDFAQTEWGIEVDCRGRREVRGPLSGEAGARHAIASTPKSWNPRLVTRTTTPWCEVGD